MRLAHPENGTKFVLKIRTILRLDFGSCEPPSPKSVLKQCLKNPSLLSPNLFPTTNIFARALFQLVTDGGQIECKNSNTRCEHMVASFATVLQPSRGIDDHPRMAFPPALNADALIPAYSQYLSFNALFGPSCPQPHSVIG